MGIKSFFERITLSVYEENDTPATRETYVNENGDEVQIIRKDDSSTPLVYAKSGSSEHGIIRVTEVEQKTQLKK